MKLYRIICMNREKTAAVAEIIAAPLRMVNDSVYYTECRGRTWDCTYDYISGRIVADPVIISTVCAALDVYKIEPFTGSVYTNNNIPADVIRAARPGLFGGV